MNKEAIEKLVEYCKWCNAQGGQCQLNLDGCAIGDALAILRKAPEQPPAGDFTKELINTWNDYLSTSFAISNIPHKRELCSKVNGLIGKVCARLDRSEASRKELLTACELAFRWHTSSKPVMRADKLKKVLESVIKQNKEISGEKKRKLCKL